MQSDLIINKDGLGVFDDKVILIISPKELRQLQSCIKHYSQAKKANEKYRRRKQQEKSQISQGVSRSESSEEEFGEFKEMSLTRFLNYNVTIPQKLRSTPGRPKKRSEEQIDTPLDRTDFLHESLRKFLAQQNEQKLEDEKLSKFSKESKPLKGILKKPKDYPSAEDLF
nr:hypothetical protein pmam_248 [Pithovirus mammoth]